MALAILFTTGIWIGLTDLLELHSVPMSWKVRMFFLSLASMKKERKRAQKERDLCFFSLFFLDLFSLLVTNEKKNTKERKKKKVETRRRKRTNLNKKKKRNKKRIFLRKEFFFLMIFAVVCIQLAFEKWFVLGGLLYQLKKFKPFLSCMSKK